MTEMPKNDHLLLIVIILAVLMPVCMLCYLLTEPAAASAVPVISDCPAVYLAAVPYVPFSLLLWRLACCNEKSKPLRLTLGLAGAAGIIAPVMLCQSQAYGLSGLWQLVWCGMLLQSGITAAKDRMSAAMAIAAAVLGTPIMIYSFMLAVSHAAV